MRLMKKMRIIILTLFLVLISVSGVLALDGTPKNQIVDLNGFKFYYNKDGQKVKNQFVTIKTQTYFFDKVGVMKENELFDKGSYTYYADANGVIAKNKFVKLGNKRYFFNSSGRRETGWINHGGHTYYCPASGAAYKSQWKKIGSYYYYFTSSYYIRKNKWVDNCFVDKNGHRIIAPFPKNTSKKVIKMTNIKQNPELPTGCESVALTSVLKFYGFNISKTTIASSYMPRSSSNFVTAFCGNPFSGSGAGIYAPGLTNTANKYLTAKKSSLKAYNVSGKEFTALNKYIDAGIPVIVWNTMYMQNPVPVRRISCLGKTWTFYQSEHCVVYCGYDPASGKVLINDPLSGLVWRNASAFKNLYNKLGKMAVIIK